mmetsp:Transcript_4398/g.12861  ORF Transcript_4398/g.12861 Transcript_4398/m.12861 type:complete len:713 (-) Transcript_4398:6-2144(-)
MSPIVDAGKPVASSGEEAEEASPSHGDWNLSEEEVQQEKDQSLARMEMAKAHVKTQEGVMHRINAKLAENGEYDALAGGFSQGQGFSAFGSVSSSWSPMQLEGHGSPEQRHNARVVSEAMLRRRERFANFARRRKELVEQHRKCRDKIAVELEAADVRSAQRQRERLEESHRRAFAAQQRRNEQQKVFKENQREKDRAWEAYYLQDQRSRAAGRASARRHSASEIDDTAETDIYRLIQRSHASYAGTMERWRQFEAENERRTEAHRRKLLLGSSGRLSAEEEGERSVSSRARRSHGGKDVQKPRRDFSHKSRKDSTPVGNLDETGCSSLLEDMAESGGELSQTQGSLPPVLSTSSSTWEMRRERCAQRAADEFQRGQEKMEQKEQAVQEARNRIDSSNKDKSDRAADQNRRWRERNDAAAQRRAELDFKTDDDMVKKQEEAARRLAEDRRARDEERTEHTLAKDKAAREAQATAQSLTDKAVERAAARQQHKETLCQQNLMMKIQDFEQRASSPAHAEMAKEKHLKKVGMDKEFRTKVQQSIDVKDAKTMRVISQKSQLPLERERILRKERCSSGLPLGSPLSATLTSLGRTIGSPATRFSSPGNTGRLSLSLPTLPLVEGGETPGACQGPLTGETTQRSLHRLVDPGNADVLSELQHAVAFSEGGAHPPRPDSPMSAVDMDDEQAFLKELEVRSVKWLKDLRRTRAAWKPF